MAMLSLATPPKSVSSSSLLLPSTTSAAVHRGLLFHKPNPPAALRRRQLISASKLPTPPPYPPPAGATVYQPFRPPPSQLPAKYKSLDPIERLDILRDRIGLWHEYAPLITNLFADSFTAPTIEEATGITGVDQNRLVVGAQVRDSLMSSSFDPDLLAFFDSAGGADYLYELRLLNATQRVSAARHVIELRLDPKGAQELARAMKDFPRRRGDDGWDRFTAASPGDCLAYTHFRLSREAIVPAERLASLERALKEVETENAKSRIEEEIERANRRAGAGADEEEERAMRVTVPVVRLHYGEVAEATTVVLLPVCKAEEGEEGLAAAPGWCKAEGELGIVSAEKGWGRWVVLPGWAPMAAAAAEGRAVAVEFYDGRVLPWGERNKWAAEETVMVVADRRRREVTGEEGGDGFYVVAGQKEGGVLEVERGRMLLEKGVKEALGKVVVVVRPPREDDDELRDEDWD